jgi:hypothetical protein
MRFYALFCAWREGSHLQPAEGLTRCDPFSQPALAVPVGANRRDDAALVRLRRIEPGHLGSHLHP